MISQILIFIGISIYLGGMPYFYRRLTRFSKRMPLRDTLIIGIVCIPLWPILAPIVRIIQWIHA